MSKKIAVYLAYKGVKGWNVSEQDLDFLKSCLPGYVISNAESTEEFENLLGSADIALSWYYKDEWIERFPNVKVFGTPAAGGDFLPRSPKNNMKIIRGSFHGVTMSESVIAMILDHTRRIAESNYRMKNGEMWPRSELDKSLKSLTGAHVAILGFGSIGMITAKRLKAFDCKITGVRRTVVDSPDFFTEGDSIINFNSLMSKLESVDHLVSFLPGSEDTDDVININIFKALPRDAAIYNLGRGNSVSEDDLIYALDNNLIAAAYLDVFKEEPLPIDSPLRRVDNLYLMPHASAISPDYMRLFFRELPQKIKEL